MVDDNKDEVEDMDEEVKKKLEEPEDGDTTTSDGKDTDGKDQVNEQMPSEE